MKQSVVARICNVSQAYVSTSLAGKKNGRKSDRIRTIAEINYEHLQQLIKLTAVEDICQIAIDKGRSSEIKKTAAILQCLSLKYRGENPLGKTGIEDETVKAIFDSLIFDEDSVFNLLASQNLYFVCETAINKSRNAKVKTIASLIQSMNITLQKNMSSSHDV